MNYSYLRVSTTDKNQTVENQRMAIKASGMHVDVWYEEEISGTVRALLRPEFSKMTSVMVKGDSLVVTMVDRLGRDAEDILNSLNNFERMGVKVYVLQFGMLDLTSTMGKMIVTVFAAVAEMERNNLLERTFQGIARTRAQGTKFGRPFKITPKHLEAMMKGKEEGMTLDELSKKYKYDRATIGQNLNKWKGKLDEYLVEYNIRAEQYKGKKA